MPQSLTQIADIVTRKIGKTDSAAVALCKDFIRSRYRMIYDAALWKETRLSLSISVTSGTTTVFVPHEMERVISARWDVDTVVWPADHEFLFESDSGIYDRTGTPRFWTALANSGVAVAPGAKAITIVSSSASDTGLTVQVRGEVGTTEDFETITLNGTTEATGTKLWTTITHIGKPTTVGRMTVTNSDDTELVVLWPKETARQHVRIQLHETPNTSKTLLLLGKRRPRELWEDADAPILRNIDNALLAYSEGDMLEYGKQYAKAQVKFQEAAGHVAVMRSLDSDQEGRIARIVPAYSGEWQRDDFTTSTGGWMKD